METKQLNELLLQSLEHERGGVKIYQAAIDCALDENLKEELEKYLEETEKHVTMLSEVMETMGIDVEMQTPGRQVVAHLGRSLLGAITMAAKSGPPEAAELVACECVVLAETKDHLNWTLLSECAKKLSGEQGKALKAAVAEVEDEEDEHLYHSKGWCRELWMKALGMKAVLPPPEERKHVKTAIGAARAEQQRGEMR
jgi:ferritin-like metal-binding protein YciE